MKTHFLNLASALILMQSFWSASNSVLGSSVRLHVFTSEGQNKTFDVIYDINQTLSSICNPSKNLVKLISIFKFQLFDLHWKIIVNFYSSRFR
jgi:hypothetical protein